MVVYPRVVHGRTSLSFRRTTMARRSADGHYSRVSEVLPFILSDTNILLILFFLKNFQFLFSLVELLLGDIGRSQISSDDGVFFYFKVSLGNQFSFSR